MKPLILCVMLAAAAMLPADEPEAVPIKSHYEVLLKYLGWTDAGQVIASGVWPVGAIKSTKYPDQAYQLGKSIKKKA